MSHFETIYNQEVFSARKHTILNILHEEEFDFRKMAMLKNLLFDSLNLRDDKYVPMSDWNEQVKYLCQDGLNAVEPLILREI